MTRRFLYSALCIFLAPLLMAQELNPAGAHVQSASPSSSPTPAAAPALVSIPKDTKIELMTLKTISSETATAGSHVQFVVANDVTVNGVTVFYAGAPVMGIVTHAKRGIANHQWAGLKIRVKELQIGNGPKLRLTSSNPKFRTTPREFFSCAAFLPGCVQLMIMASMGCGEDSCSSKPNAESGQQAVLPACVTSDFWTAASTDISLAQLAQGKASVTTNLTTACPRIVELSKIFRQPGVSFVEIK